MESKEKDLLQRAVNEIGQLRHQNQLMSARLEVYDQMMLLFQTTPAYQGQGMSPDIAWEIKQHLETEEKSPS